ncbi:hypothetical protein R3P38DRAFT_1046782 [Favolaschia claudopus]|uniref:Uncharacterized protein n=1 Tax=Favolaschia claudopus TaxID=2862362 RepID=A0AAW0BJB3_9AGAR
MAAVHALSAGRGKVSYIFVFGICAAQFTTYFVSARRRQDTLIIRILVIWEFLLSIFCAVVSAYFVWLYLVENYFNPAFLASAPCPLTAVPLLSGLSSFNCWNLSRPVPYLLTRRFCKGLLEIIADIYHYHQSIVMSSIPTVCFFRGYNSPVTRRLPPIVWDRPFA